LPDEFIETLNKSLAALNALPLLIDKIFEYKLVIDPLVELNDVIVADGEVITGMFKFPFWFTNHDLFESETLINPNVELLL
jgi:hypothetical protein